MSESLTQLSLEDIQSAILVTLPEKIDTESKPVQFDPATNNFVFQCPHCDLFVEVGRNEVACSIFRHAYYFTRTPEGHVVLTGQLNPHAPKQLCDQLLAEGKIYGCGKPFKMDRVGDGYTVRICDYI